MTAYVFAGPTLPHSEIEGLCDAVCLPPAAQGDVYRAAQNRPRVIGIIDGYFEGVPSVWHKEILWAMSQGIHVLGSASMGALRAAELADFGMAGVGEIFQAYRDGRLQDDDEVAVLHGPAETGYLALSEAMVNIRATLGRAREERVIASATGTLLEELAKSLYYPDRSWDTILVHPRAGALPGAERDALRAWLPDGRVDAKRADARAMLAEMRALLASDPAPKCTDYSFEWTEMWDGVTADSTATGQHSDGSAGTPAGAQVLDELRLEGEAFRQVQRQALLRLLALRESERRRLRVDHQAVNDSLSRFRKERALYQRKDLDAWLAASDIPLESLENLMENETRLDAVISLFEPALDPHLFNTLRLNGSYARLTERAGHKNRMLTAKGLEDPQPGRVGPTPAGLLVWYFERRLGEAIPDDIEGFARGLGFGGKSEFYRVLLREYLYLSLNAESEESESGS